MMWSALRSARPAVMLGLAISMCGCSLVPAYLRPNTVIPDKWETANSEGASPTVSAHGTWWTSFNNSELTNLVQQSLAGNFNLQAAVVRIVEADGTAEIAGAPLYPSLDVAGTIDHSNGLKSSRTQSLFAQASYEFDFWGKNRAIANSADALTRATAFDSHTVALTLTASVTDTYFQILSLQERVQLAQEIADSARRILALIEAQAASGVASDLQIEQQRNQVATFDAAVPVLRQQLDQNTHLLAVLIGSTPEAFKMGGQNLSGITVPAVQADMPAAVLGQRPDIQAAEARLIAANFDVGAARAAFYPSFTLTGQMGIVSSSLSHFFPAAVLTDIAAGVLQPVFSGGLLEGQLKVDRARAVELTASYRQTIITALQDVEDALTAVERLQQLEAIDQVAVESARRASDLANIQYRLGAMDFLTVLTAERTLYQAEDALLQVHLQRLQAAVGVFRALGGNFSADAQRTVQANRSGTVTNTPAQN